MDAGSCPLRREAGVPRPEIQTPELQDHAGWGLEQPGLVAGDGTG